jgi:hypothetical protein
MTIVELHEEFVAALAGLAIISMEPDSMTVAAITGGRNSFEIQFRVRKFD